MAISERANIKEMARNAEMAGNRLKFLREEDVSEYKRQNRKFLIFCIALASLCGLIAIWKM